MLYKLTLHKSDKTLGPVIFCAAENDIDFVEKMLQKFNSWLCKPEPPDYPEPMKYEDCDEEWENYKRKKEDWEDEVKQALEEKIIDLDFETYEWEPLEISDEVASTLSDLGLILDTNLE